MADMYSIISNTKLTDSVYKMVLKGDTSKITNPGQFVNILLKEKYLRRPISICDYDESTITIIYKVVGGGTQILSNLKEGVQLDVLTGLGNGYDISKSSSPVLLGGGVGIPPMYNLAKTLLKNNQTPKVILGFNTKSEIFYKEEFEALGIDVYVTTVDGSEGIKGFVTDVMKNLDYDYFYTCGPLPMFKAIDMTTKTSGQFSLEERMGCGFGACMGCSIKTNSGFKRVCKDGPVFEREDIIW